MNYEEIVRALEARRKRVRSAKRPAESWEQQLARLDERRARRLVGAKRSLSAEDQLAGVNARSERAKKS
jgi:hypothetical protein